MENAFEDRNLEFYIMGEALHFRGLTNPTAEEISEFIFHKHERLFPPEDIENYLRVVLLAKGRVEICNGSDGKTRWCQSLY